MAKFASPGRCAYCDGEFPRSRMTVHLKSCKQKPPAPALGPSVGKAFQIAIEDRYIPVYWLQVEASPEATLQDLDQFLRYIWLECCGHMSAFNFGWQSYTSVPHGVLDSGLGDEFESMYGVSLASKLAPNGRFTYEYDFGTTTELNLRVVAIREPWMTERGVHLLARNVPPDVQCEECGKPATFVCPACVWDEGAWFCTECAEDHDCGIDFMLPVVNSPRTGMCAYAGNAAPMSL